MDHQFCPGAKVLRQPQPEMFDCPSCGEEVEIWTDEIRGLCHNCGRAVFREGYMSCLEWCKYGQDCVGEEAYDRYMKNRAVGLRRKLLEGIQGHWGENASQIQFAEQVLSWSEEILKDEKADWHIVIPASILHNIGSDDEAEGLQTAKDILLRSGLMSEEIEKICRIIEHGPSDNVESNVVHDAVLLARLEPGELADGAFRTETGKKLAKMSYSKAAR
jgi:predicted RNA-binding Zn-ribbon protein involved in translation (DUF1610 family)